jgi:chromosome segregation ATPase
VIISREEDIQRLIYELQSQNNIFSGPPSPEEKLSFHSKNARLEEKEKSLVKLAVDLHDLREKLEADQKQNIEEFEYRMNALHEAQLRLAKEKQSFQEEKTKIAKKMRDLEEKTVNFNTERFSMITSQIEFRPRDDKAVQTEIAKISQENECKKCKNLRIQTTEKPQEKECQKCKEYREILKSEFREKGCEQCRQYCERLSHLQQQSHIDDIAKEKIANLEETCSKLKESLEFLTGKLKIVEFSREEIENENCDLRESLNAMKEKKQAFKERVQELETVTSVDSSDEKKALTKLSIEFSSLRNQNEEVIKENKKLSQNLAVLALQYEELEQQHKELQMNSQGTPVPSLKMPDELKKIYEELEFKFQKVQQKEKELQDLQESLLNERKSVEAAAEYVKNIHEELNMQKSSIEEEKEANEKQRVKILELDKKQQNKGKLLINKEKELLMLKEKLGERERLLVLKEKQFETRRDLDV